MTPTRVTTPFTRESTAAEVAAGIELPGRRMIVTGGASGLGIETARALAGTGAEVTLAVRDTTAGARVAAELIESTGNQRIDVAPLDLTDPRSVAAFVEAWSGPLHVLVNNAGVMAAPLSRTAAGWELQFGTNHLGHFQLATGLHRALAAAEGARVVSVSSAAHLRSPVVFDDIMFVHRDYDPWLSYGQSKTANVLFAVEAAKRWGDDGIAVNSLHPGGIRTALQRYVSDEELDRMRTAAGASVPNWKTPEQGAATSVLLAVSRSVGCVTGRYFEDCNEAPLHEDGAYGGVAAYALDPAHALRLWEISEGLTA